MGGALPYATFTWGAPPLLVYKGITITRVNIHSGKRGIFLQQNTKHVFTVSDRGGKGKIYMYMYTFIFAVKVA